jgi:Spy/CpxP family protein refolding chaperone
MKKILIVSIAILSILFTGCATSQTSSSSRADNQQYEEPVANTKLNNKRLEKNLAKFSKELNLSKRQQKDLKRIDKRYARKERKLSRKDKTKKRDLRQLATEKREEMLYILTREQQQKLEALVKKGRFSFDNWFGK